MFASVRRARALSRPGHFVVVNADGSIEGPRPWDNSIRNVIEKVSFPLFGNRLDADRTRPYGMTDRRTTVDQIEESYQHRGFADTGNGGIGGARRR